MGIIAENTSKKYGITREAQDEFAIESHRRAARATQNGYFQDQIVPLTVKSHAVEFAFEKDEHIHEDATLEGMSKLRATFKKDGLVTAGNASGLNDGAASVILMTEEASVQKGAAPMARVLSYGHAGVDPKYMGIDPVPAMQNALSHTGLSVVDLDVMESNEAFAARACAVSSELVFDPSKVNPNGGAIAVGHPVGASGAVITAKFLYELQRSVGRYGAATMCIGGGQDIALIVENLCA